MSDLPTPQDAAEAALFSECWDAVLSYADLCTSGSVAGRQLATEAFTHGIQEIRATDARGRTTGRRTPRLPGIPLLLTAVRTTAMAWEAQGHGQRLDPELRLWLNSEKAARYAGPPLTRPLALRGLKDMQEPDAALLWLAEVEALPLSDVARRLHLDPARAAAELDQVRALFRDRCRRSHLDAPMAPDCRRYAGLLDAVTRSPAAETPEDLSRHLALCVECAEAAACLRLHGGGTPAALASGVIGWGGLAYLERRRRAAEAGLSGGRADAGTDRGIAPGIVTRPRIGRTGILVGAVIVSALALTVSLLQSGASGGDEDTRGDAADQSAGVPAPSSSDASSGDDTFGSSSTSRPAGPETATGDDDSDTEPQGESTSPVDDPSAGLGTVLGTSTACRVAYQVVNEWTDGFQASVTVTSARALDDWSLAWTFADGQHITQMWDATYGQADGQVTAKAVEYNKRVAADDSVAIGFVSTRNGTNSAPRAFTVNGARCSTVG
ncbi:cellulose binding domain-containing protein [Streptomyces nodosus]|uniref:cellulose binding domain-containing protein n=1 Tax=Streptomyces nodosus TaxID=40318 RepID=UPI00380B4315